MARPGLDVIPAWPIGHVMDDRHGARSTVLASQLPVGKWHDYLGDPTIADAVLDRVVRNAHRITLKGPTMRPSIEQEKTSKT